MIENNAVKEIYVVGYSAFAIWTDFNGMIFHNKLQTFFFFVNKILVGLSPNDHLMNDSTAKNISFHIL